MNIDNLVKAAINRNLRRSSNYYGIDGYGIHPNFSLLVNDGDTESPVVGIYVNPQTEERHKSIIIFSTRSIIHILDDMHTTIPYEFIKSYEIEEWKQIPEPSNLLLELHNGAKSTIFFGGSSKDAGTRDVFLVLQAIGGIYRSIHRLA